MSNRSLDKLGWRVLLFGAFHCTCDTFNSNLAYSPRGFQLGVRFAF
jgi:hypothetical protein